jgi:hypothetical protein
MLNPESASLRLAVAALQVVLGSFTPLALISIGGVGIYAAPVLLPLLWITANASRGAGRWYLTVLASLVAAETAWAISWSLVPPSSFPFRSSPRRPRLRSSSGPGNATFPAAPRHSSSSLLGSSVLAGLERLLEAEKRRPEKSASNEATTNRPNTGKVPASGGAFCTGLCALPFLG